MAVPSFSVPDHVRMNLRLWTPLAVFKRATLANRRLFQSFPGKLCPSAVAFSRINSRKVETLVVRGASSGHAGVGGSA
eukprot:6187028-Pleurochrysis_carterae.AAC.2